MDYTPETLLELARAVMPDCHWIVNPQGKVEEPSLYHGRELLFAPLNNPAHWAAVEKWLFTQPIKVRKDNHYMNNHPYIIEWTNSDGCVFGHNIYDTNLAAAVAVLERKKGEAK